MALASTQYPQGGCQLSPHSQSPVPAMGQDTKGTGPWHTAWPPECSKLMCSDSHVHIAKPSPSARPLEPQSCLWLL